MAYSSTDIDYLLSPAAIRKQAKAAFDLCVNDQSHFVLNENQIEPTVKFVLQVMKIKYPDLKIPFHSRWGHFRVGHVDRIKQFDVTIMQTGPLEIARTKLDLVITSVLLDAGAGVKWKFIERDKAFSRSEGLGVASFHMFKAGGMSSDGTARADAAGLMNISTALLEKYFQVSADNPLVGVSGRVSLLNNLGKVLQENQKMFKDGRPGNIIDYLSEKHGRSIPATAILRAVLDGFGPIWPGRVIAAGINLGDVWNHSKLGLVPLHKLSQWMTYSLIEPISEAGFTVTGVENLTGLAEYRNGGLMLDSGILSFKTPEEAHEEWGPETDLVIEWRALTIFLLDQIAEGVRAALGKTPQELPLAKVLEGGTWWAGRTLAEKYRAGATPPLKIKSDGTVF